MRPASGAMRWLCALSLALSVNMAVRAQGPSVTRELVPWWETDSVDAIAAKRRASINPTNWTEQESHARTLHIVGNLGNFDGYGRVRILDLFSTADLFHYPGDPYQFNGAFHVTYEVLEPVPDIHLLSCGGSAGWDLLNDSVFAERLYSTREYWKVDQKGVFALRESFLGWAAKGYRIEKGVYQLARHSGYQLYRMSTKQWVDICNLSSTQEKRNKKPCLSLQSLPSVVRDTRFTVADLTKYSLGIGEVSSDWRVGGYIGVRVGITDAAGIYFDVPGAEVEAIAMSERGLHEAVALPLEPVKAFFPDGTRWGFRTDIHGVFWELARIEVHARVLVLGPDGVLRTENLERTVTRKDCPALPADQWLTPPPRPDLRTKDGRLVESRLFACGGKTLLDNPSPVSKLEGRQKHEWLVDLAKKANANILAFLVLANGWSYVPSDIIGTRTHVPKEYDNLKLMVDRAHANGIEAHVWICYAHGGWDPPQAPQVLALHPDWAARDANGKPVGRGVADVHRPEFRELMLRYTLDLVRRYPVDGVLLDYIRAMAQCFCEECRKEYQETYHRDLVDDGRAYAPTYVEWQERAIELFVQALRRELNGIRPGIRLSAFVGNPPSDRAHNIQGQAGCAEWLRKGWVDALLPMLYGDLEGNIVRWQDYALTSKRPDHVWPTMYNYLKAYFVDENDTSAEVSQRNPDGTPAAFVTAIEGMESQVRHYRNGCHVRGIAVFDLENATEKHAREIAERLWTEPAVPYWGPRADPPPDVKPSEP